MLWFESKCPTGSCVLAVGSWLAALFGGLRDLQEVTWVEEVAFWEQTLDFRSYNQTVAQGKQLQLRPEAVMCAEHPRIKYRHSMVNREGVVRRD